MTRAELEHVSRAAADIADDDEIVVTGSQAVLGQYPEAPASLRVSVEADVYPRHRPERADVPRGWQARLVPVRNANTRGAAGWCLEVHDLLISKAVAGREKDRAFVREAIRHGLVQAGTLRRRLVETPVDEVVAARVRAWIEADLERA